MRCVMILSAYTQIEQKRSEIKTRIRQLFNLKPLIFLCLVVGHNRLPRMVKEQRSHNRLVKPNLQQLREHGMAWQKKGIKRIKRKRKLFQSYFMYDNNKSTAHKVFNTKKTAP